MTSGEILAIESQKNGHGQGAQAPDWVIMYGLWAAGTWFKLIGKARLAVFHAARIVIGKSLTMLGLKPLEKM